MTGKTPNHAALNAEENIKDFDVLAPPKRLAKIGGEIVDVSFIPTRIALEIMSLGDFEESSFSADVFDKVVDITVKICQRSNSKITREWILDNIEPMTLMKFLVYAVESLSSRISAANKGEGKGEGEGKN
jgi:hypothetical protein